MPREVMVMTLNGLAILIALCTAVCTWCVVDLLTRGLMRYREAFEVQAGIELRDLYLFIDPMHLWVLSLAIMGLAGGICGWLSRSLALSLVTALAASALPYLSFHYLRKRRLHRLEAQLPDALLGLASTLRAGQSLSSALHHSAAQLQVPLAQEWRLMLREQRLGVSLEQALIHFAQRVPSESVVIVVSALRVAIETGGGLADNLERIGATVRASLHMHGKIDALTAQGRLQAWVVGLLPLALIGILQRLEPEAMALLWTSRPGWGVLATVFCLEALGLWWIRRIVAVDV